MFHAGACCELKTVFSTHRHPASKALVQHTQCPCRFVILATKALQSQSSETVIYIDRKCNKIPVSILTRVASGLFSWSMAAGLLAFSSRQFGLQSIMDLCPLHTIFLSKQAWRAAYAARGAKRLVYNIYIRISSATNAACISNSNAIYLVSC